MDPTLLVIVGPTGSGKSALALHLAARFGGELINADSIQLYRGFNIGSAKTPVAERGAIPHHLLDVLDAESVPSAGDYARWARAAAAAVAARGRLPIVVGGTGFYIRALIDGLPALPERDAEVRAKLAARSTARLYRLLQRLDPKAAARVRETDPQRVVRALEIRLVTGAGAPPAASAEPLRGFRVVQFGLQPPVDALREAIAERSRKMFAEGLADEVRQLLASGCTGEEKPFGSIGYKQALAHVRGQLTREEAEAQTTIATRQYAKRQRTWFRADLRIQWLQGFGHDPAIQHQAEEMFQAR